MTFQQRLHACMQDGNLRIADLARWFGRPHSTLRTWIHEGREPSGPAIETAWIRGQLKKLEKKIGQKKGFPVPTGLSPRKRIEHIDGLR